MEKGDSFAKFTCNEQGDDNTIGWLFYKIYPKVWHVAMGFTMWTPSCDDGGFNFFGIKLGCDLTMQHGIMKEVDLSNPFR